MNICLFTANHIGELLLAELDKRHFYPDVVTYTRGFQRTTLAKDLGSFRKEFNMTFIASNSYLTCDKLQDISDRTIVCVDWTKDFFKDAELVGMDVIFAHPSLLPAYRGYSAVTEQFVRGVTVSGASFYKQGNRIDAGDIIHSAEIRIGYQDYPDDFLRKYASACADFIVELNKKGVDAYEAVPQNEDMSFYLQRKRGKDSIIDFNRDAFSLYNHIRGYSRPFFGAYYMSEGKKVNVWRAFTEVWQGDYGCPGEVLSVTDNGAEIACGSGTITFKEVEIDGKVYKGEQLKCLTV
ncbi:formyl transferase domain protein [Denitrovibrio acetiphilus DSM 12809]|jgi:methionyl-tRNA formyltransferase|uniref:Methionyl-tRNA formyltransferase n=1 Tax=Denitrovibrio acetiphilus (strain DSM 12809 / NBRC 114555 / N2460) TaxID=522772 RepID=D4H4C7_DENA2|nr:formyltransferase family protein [Denitrovibrio acetiphilus]ADD69256.1 formyl transferase domain protein [Denitrovibrio acetiphilus DSM 12809]